MRSSPKFVVARVHGKAVGGGVGLVAAADYAFGTQGSALRLSEFEIGLGPFVIGPAVERKIGVAQFSAMAIDCAWRDPDWARQHGLFQSICQDTPELNRVVEEFALELSKRNPAATAALKQALWAGTEHWPQLLADRARNSANLVVAKNSAN
jgi:methylglutaconyl-CoA hydratase